MDDYTIVFARSAREELEEFHGSMARRLLRRIEALAGEPRPTGCRKLTDSKNLWRIRVGDYRVLYSIDDRARLIDIIAIRHRKEAYE
jgi:mRNA interferase RelE/StbE